MKENKTKILLITIFSLILVTLILFTVKDHNKLSANLKLGKEFKVEIKKVNFKGMSGKAENKETKLSDESIELNAVLYGKGDSATYSIIVENTGDIDAKLTKIKTNIGDLKTTNSHLSLKTTGLKEGDIIQKKRTKTLDVTIALDDSEENIAPELNVKLNVEFEFSR